MAAGLLIAGAALVGGLIFLAQRKPAPVFPETTFRESEPILSTPVPTTPALSPSIILPQTIPVPSTYTPNLPYLEILSVRLWDGIGMKYIATFSIEAVRNGRQSPYVAIQVSVSDATRVEAVAFLTGTGQDIGSGAWEVSSPSVLSGMFSLRMPPGPSTYSLKVLVYPQFYKALVEMLSLEVAL